MNKLTSILLIAFFMQSGSALAQMKDNTPTNKASGQLIYENYRKAFSQRRLGRTVSYYVVITVKNLNTREQREICTSSIFLLGALYSEYHTKSDSIVLSYALNEHRYLQLGNPKALENICFERLKDTTGLNTDGYSYDPYYTIKELHDFEKSKEFKSYADALKKDGNTGMISSEKKLLMTAHILFNRGIPTAEVNCSGGSLYAAENTD